MLLQGLFSSCGSWAALIAGASLVVEPPGSRAQGLQWLWCVGSGVAVPQAPEHRLNCCGARSEACGILVPRPGIEPVSQVSLGEAWSLGEE